MKLSSRASVALERRRSDKFETFPMVHPLSPALSAFVIIECLKRDGNGLTAPKFNFPPYRVPRISRSTLKEFVTCLFLTVSKILYLISRNKYKKEL